MLMRRQNTLRLTFGIVSIVAGLIVLIRTLIGKR